MKPCGARRAARWPSIQAVRDALRIRKVAERRGEELAHGHDPARRPSSIAGGGRPSAVRLFQLREEVSKHGARLDAQLSRSRGGVFDALEPRPVRAVSPAASRDSRRSVIPVSAECTTTAPPRRCARAEVGDVVPVGDQRHARVRRTGADPGALKGTIRVRKCRAALFPTAARPRRLPRGSRPALPRLAAAPTL